MVNNKFLKIISLVLTVLLLCSCGNMETIAPETAETISSTVEITTKEPNKNNEQLSEEYTTEENTNKEYTTEENTTNKKETSSVNTTSTKISKETEKETTKKRSEKVTSDKPSTTISHIVDKATTTKRPTEIKTTSPTTEKETTQQPTTQKQTEPETKPIPKNVCYITIDCRNIKKNIKELTKGKAQFVPKNGYILKRTPVELKGGETVFDVLKTACKENSCTDNCKYCKNNGIHLEFTFTTMYNSCYIEGIHQLYEFDCGTKSGWMYKVNGMFPHVSTSSCSASVGDEIHFVYTCNGGEDVGDKIK